MKACAVSRIATRTGPRSWTCSTCRGQPVSVHTGWRQFHSARRPSRGGGGRRGRSRRALLLAATGAAGVATTTLAFTDDIKNSYEAAERTGRVVAALAICINDYRTTLNAKAAVEDQDAQDRVLRACHRRCAERTLKLLEKNGGIFIKLGQHLVR